MPARTAAFTADWNWAERSVPAVTLAASLRFTMATRRGGLRVGPLRFTAVFQFELLLNGSSSLGVALLDPVQEGAGAGRLTLPDDRRFIVVVLRLEPLKSFSSFGAVGQALKQFVRMRSEEH